MLEPGGYSTLDRLVWVWVSNPRGGTQLWVGYGCAARRFRPPPYNKTREDANLQPITKPFASWRTLFKTNQYFLPYKLGCISTFWQPIGKLKGKIQRKLCILQKCNLYLNQFSNKKGAIGKPERPKKHPIWAAHPRTHLSTKYPPPPPEQPEGLKMGACRMDRPQIWGLAELLFIFNLFVCLFVIYKLFMFYFFIYVLIYLSIIYLFIYLVS